MKRTGRPERTGLQLQPGGKNYRRVMSDKRKVISNQ